MNFLAPLLLVLAVVIPIKLAGDGIRLRNIGIGCALVCLCGLSLFISGMNAATPEAAASGDPGRTGIVGILFIVSALCAGITTFITGIVRAMSGKS